MAMKKSRVTIKRKKPKAAKRKITVATEFSGLETPSRALDNVGIPSRLAYACEYDKKLRDLIGLQFKPEMLADDITTRKVKKLPNFDLYVAGPSCQPFSHCGRLGGREDYKGRGNHMFLAIDTILHKEPKAFVLENVAALVQMKNFESIWKEINKRLGKKYHIKHEIINAADNMLPQNRRRVYIVGWLKKKNR